MGLEHFLGKDGFIWWEGIVENRQDPLKLGRCKVRIFGWHTDSVDQLPTSDLPWAHPSLPLNNATPKAPAEGAFVWGFFRDGPVAQEPIMVGILPGIPKPNTTP